MKHFDIEGMSCAACSTRVEKAVSQIDGVTNCSVSLLTNSMILEGTASDTEIIEAVKKAGYGAKTHSAGSQSDDDTLADKETPKLVKRLIYSFVFLALLMYVSMGHKMWGWPLPSFFSGNHISLAILELLLTIIVMLINKKFFVSGFLGLKNRAPNMDTLVALGSGASFIYSTFVLFMMTDVQLKGGNTHRLLHDLYFESAAMILALITLGKMLEARSKGKTTNALKSLMALAPKTAIIEEGGLIREVPASSIKAGDIFLVKAGSAIPADGIILSGHGAVDESALTGESLPVDKTEGDTVSAATVNRSGFFKCRANRVGEDTALSQIIKMVSDAASTKAPISKVADKVSGVFVPIVILIALITTIVWLIAGETIGYALSRGISVLVISCPCALGLATPVAIMVSSGIGAKGGILFKTAASLEETGRIQIVALDKTGTITTGEPAVCDIITDDETELLTIAASLEAKSEHPLAKAIMNEAKLRNITLLESEDFITYAGNGLFAKIDNADVYGGNFKFISEKIHIPDDIIKKADELSSSGKTPLYFTSQGKLLGVIAVADTLRDDSIEAIRQLHNMGISVVMITGDNERTANAIKNQVGIDKVISGVLPGGKENEIQKLKKLGKTAMVGDGINDAPALASADIGIAIGSGTDVAIDSADVVLINSRLTDVPAAIRLSRRTLKNIHENLFWAFIYNIIGIPLAAGVWIPAFGLTLSPMFGALAMSLSSFCVVTNALRLNFIDIKSTRGDRKIKSKKEKKKMEKILKIEGMMCPHCEARVKKVLEELDGVESVIASHEEKTAKITLSKDVPHEILKKTVEEQDYTVLD